jgi:hypothetical protein
MIRTDRHRHLPSCKHISQRIPAASPSNVIRMSAQNASDFYSPQNFIRSSEPTSEHKKSRQSNTNPMIHGRHPSDGRDLVRRPRGRSRSPEPSLIKGEKHRWLRERIRGALPVRGFLGRGIPDYLSSVLTRETSSNIACLTTYVV